MKRNYYRIAYIAVFMLLFLQNANATGFTDDHDDWYISGWTSYGGRVWSERYSYATPSAGYQQGYLINNYDCVSNGTLEVNITASQWDGEAGGVVFRWSSSTNYLYVAVEPGNEWTSSIRLCRNSTNFGNGTVIASPIDINTTYILKIVMNNSTFKFYLNDEYMGEVQDENHPAGKVGYGYSTIFSDYINYNSITWTDAEFSNNAPTDITLSNSSIDEGLPSGTAVGIFTTIDPDAGDTHTYTLVSGTGGADNSYFTIDSNYLKTAAVFDYSIQQQYSILVRSTDDGEGNLFYEKQFTIAINEIENYEDWQYSADLGFNTTPTGADVAGTVTNFPVLIRLNSVNFDFTEAATDGRDIRFADQGGEHLSYEIELWDPLLEQAALWVKVPAVDGNSDQDYIRMYWGIISVDSKSNSEAVFETSENYTGVWHLNDTCTGIGVSSVYKDATANNNDGYDYVTYDAPGGIVGNGVDFDGDSDYIDIRTIAGKNRDSLTISSWIKPKPQSSWADIISKEDNNYNNAGFGIRRTDNDEIAFSLHNGAKQELYGIETEINDDGSNWYFITVMYDGLKQSIYINGSLSKINGGMSGSITATSQNLNIGRQISSGSNYFKGHIDELRMSEKCYDSSWVKLSYENQKENQSLVYFISGGYKVAAPSQFSATTFSDSGILLTWHNNATNATGIEILYGNDESSLVNLTNLSDTAYSYFHFIDSCGVSYIYGIQAYNDTDKSELVLLDNNAYTIPCVPENAQAVALSESEIIVSWVGSAPEYILEYKDTGSVWSLLYTGGYVSFPHQGLPCNTTFYYRVKAVNPAGHSDWSNTASATTNSCGINSPSGLYADNSVVEEITLFWQDMSPNEDGFIIFRKCPGDSCFSILDSVPELTTVYTDTAIECNTTYEYYVQAYADSAVSGGSNHVTVTSLFCGAGKKTSELITVTGMVITTLGEPLTEEKEAIVQLYTKTADSAIMVYEESFSNVHVKNGYVSIAVGYNGDVVSVIRNSKALYYDIIIDSASIFDKLKPVTASPYSIQNPFNVGGSGSPVGRISAPQSATYVDIQNALFYIQTGDSTHTWIKVGN